MEPFDITNKDTLRGKDELPEKYKRRSTQFLSRWTSSMYEEQVELSPELAAVIK